MGSVWGSGLGDKMTRLGKAGPLTLAVVAFLLSCASCLAPDVWDLPALPRVLMLYGEHPTLPTVGVFLTSAILGCARNEAANKTCIAGDGFRHRPDVDRRCNRGICGRPKRTPREYYLEQHSASGPSVLFDKTFPSRIVWLQSLRM
jgi:hypothetical protein